MLYYNCMLDKIVVFPTIQLKLTNHDYENNNKFTFCLGVGKANVKCQYQPVNICVYLIITSFFLFVQQTNQNK